MGIGSLGRRKNIIRAINFLKASVCRTTNMEASMIIGGGLSGNVNRTHGQINQLDRSHLNMASIDKSAILSSAASFFKTKGQTVNTNGLNFVNTSMDSSY